MKAKFLQLSAVIATLMLLTQKHAFAQWNLTGNGNATAASALGTTNAIPLNLITNNTNRLVIDASGKIGIGTNPALSLMTLKGAGSAPASSWISSGAPLFAGYGEATPGNADFNLMMASAIVNARPVMGMKRARGTLAAPAAVQLNDQLGSLLVSGFDGSNFQGAAAVDFFADGAALLGAVPTRISFVTGSNSSTRTERVKIGSTGNITFNNSQMFLDNSTGNIGIGTTNPTAKLEINGQIKITGGIPPTAGSVLTCDATGLAFWGSGVGQWTTSGNDIYNSNSGNIGIGLTAPQVRLHVKQDGEAIRVSGTNSFIQVADNNNTAVGYIWNNSGNFNVGVSSLNPSGKLQLATASGTQIEVGPSGFTDFKAGYVTLNSISSLQNSGNDLKLTAYAPANASGNAAGNIILARPGSLFKSGNVAVGTDDASMAKLTVQGFVGQNVAMFRRSASSAGISIAADWPEIYFNSYYNGGVKAMKAGYGGLIGLDPTSGNLYFRTGSTAAANNNDPLTFSDNLIISSSGNIGLGTYSPAYKLDVCGTIRSKELRVETGWCDYVFADNYKLRSLSEVEAFVKTNKHLPDVTAGNEIETNGLEVGKVSAQMIRKIEELTLYVIEQEKAINSLKAHNEKLEAAINLLIEKGGK